MAKQKTQAAEHQTVVKFPCCQFCATRAAVDLREDFKVKHRGPQILVVEAPQSQVDETLQDLGFTRVGEGKKAVYEFLPEDSRD